MASAHGSVATFRADYYLAFEVFRSTGSDRDWKDMYDAKLAYERASRGQKPPNVPALRPPKGGGVLTHEQRVTNYCRETGHPKSLFVSEDGRLVGTWIMGNDYRVRSAYYGGYPAGYLKRIKALFPEKIAVLHLFSGKVDVGTLPGKTVDSNAENAPDYVDDAQTLAGVPLEEFDLVCADPPYSVEDCDHYQTTMVKRNVVMRTLGARLRPGTHVVWLDQVLPMYRKDQFTLEAVIGMVKSTNHRFRVCSIFRAGGGGAEQVGDENRGTNEGKAPNDPSSLPRRGWRITSDHPNHLEHVLGPEQPWSAVAGAVDYILGVGAQWVKIGAVWKRWGQAEEENDPDQQPGESPKTL